LEYEISGRAAEGQPPLQAQHDFMINMPDITEDQLKREVESGLRFSRLVMIKGIYLHSITVLA
jgi:hypothetical protein